MFAAIAYYFKYIVRNEMMTSVAVTITTIVPIFSMLIAARLNAKYSKRNISIVGTLIQILGSLIIWIGGSNVAIVFLGVGLMGFGMGFRSNMYFSMLADVQIMENGRAEGILQEHRWQSMDFPIKFPVHVRVRL